jgi:hypothetical protein
VFEEISGDVPVNAPVDEFKDIHAGKFEDE